MFLSKFANLPPRKRIGIFALILGIIAIFAGDPYDKAKTNINLNELAISSEKDIDRVKVSELADWLIQVKMDYRLIDLRSEDDYIKYHIPSAENVDIHSILEYNLKRNEKILLYSQDNVSAAQGWFLLKAANYKSVSILTGGLEEWKNHVLFPICTCGETPSKEQLHKHNKLAEISNYFGGSIQTTANIQNERKFDMPELKAPKEIILKKSSSKKKREGC